MTELRPRPGQSGEDFLDEMDPYGDRFGTAVPLWGCLLAIAVIIAALYGVYWLIGGR